MLSSIKKCLFIVLFSIVPLVFFSQEEIKKNKVEWFGYLGAEFRYFPETGAYPDQKQTYFSGVFRPQFLFEDKTKKHQVNFIAFARLDQFDTERTHRDIRDLYWRYSSKNWEINAGIKTITWGKTESANIVDIINQYDFLEGRSLEHKLGQPLLQLVHTSKIFTTELYAMTYARELRFPGPLGRLQPGFVAAYNNSIYEEKDAKYKPDLAIRLSKYHNNIYMAVSHFYGTNRIPFFESDPNMSITPVYNQINQTAIEFQWLINAFAVKAEAINQTSSRKNIQAFTLGGEYNHYFLNGKELKFLMEYTYDERGNEQITGFNNDIFVGVRLNFNDIQSTGLNAAVIYDLDYNTTIINLTGYRRIGDSWKLAVSYNGIHNPGKEDFYYGLRKDSYFELSLLKYY